MPITTADENRYAELQEIALQYARDGETKALTKMLDHGLPVNLSNEKGNTLLMLAAYHDHPATVQMLLDYGAEVDRPNDRGQTPLAGVAFKGYKEVARILLQAEANPLASQGTVLGVEMTPLRFAMLFGRKEIQQLFEEHLVLSEPQRLPWLLRIASFLEHIRKSLKKRMS
jgi:ankyrin repeat protein